MTQEEIIARSAKIGNELFTYQRGNIVVDEKYVRATDKTGANSTQAVVNQQLFNDIDTLGDDLSNRPDKATTLKNITYIEQRIVLTNGNNQDFEVVTAQRIVQDGGAITSISVNGTPVLIYDGAVDIPVQGGTTPDGVVTITGTQLITGAKTFTQKILSSGFQINGLQNASNYVLLADGNARLISDIIDANPGGLTDDLIAAINNVVNGGYVTIAGDETITGEKTFNNSVVIEGLAPLYIGGTIFKRKSNSSELSIEANGGIDIVSGDLSVSNGSIYADEFHCNGNDSNNYVLLAGGGTKALSEIGGQGGYVRPNGGIPKTDLASDVQTALGKANTALQAISTSDYVMLGDGSVRLIADIVSANPGESSSSNPENPTTPVNGISSIYIATGDSTGTIKYRIDSGEYQSVGINGWDALSVSVASKADKSQLVNSNNGTAGFVKTISFNSQSYTATDGVFTLPYIAINNTRIATEGSGNSAKINIPIASSTALGVIKTGYSDNNKNYAVKVDSNGNAYVNVPWVSGGGNIDPTSIITAAGFKVNGYTGKDGDILFADGSYGKITGGDILMNNYGYYNSGEEPQGYIDSTDTVNDAIYKLENKINTISGSTTPVDYISTITINGSSTGVSKTGHTVDLTMTGSGTPTDLSNCVTISGNETIGGTKLFSNVVKAAGFSTGAPSGTTNVLFADGSYKDETAAGVKMTDYSKGSSAAAITITDTVSTAIGKLENKIEAVSGSTQPTIAFKKNDSSGESYGATTLIGPFNYGGAGVVTLDLSDYAKINDIPTTNSEAFTGATQNAAGTSGLVPAPTPMGTNMALKYLRNDGTWSEPVVNYGTEISTTTTSGIRIPKEGELYYDTAIEQLCVGHNVNNANADYRWADINNFTVRRRVLVSGTTYQWQPVCKHIGTLADMPRFQDLDVNLDQGYPFYLTSLEKQLYATITTEESYTVSAGTWSKVTLYVYRWRDSEGRTWVISSHNSSPGTNRNSDSKIIAVNRKLNVAKGNGSTWNTWGTGSWTGSSTSPMPTIDLGQGYTTDNNSCVSGLFTYEDIGRIFVGGNTGHTYDQPFMLTRISVDDGTTPVDATHNIYERTYTYTFKDLFDDSTTTRSAKTTYLMRAS